MRLFVANNHVGPFVGPSPREFDTAGLWQIFQGTCKGSDCSASGALAKGNAPGKLRGNHQLSGDPNLRNISTFRGHHDANISIQAVSFWLYFSDTPSKSARAHSRTHMMHSSRKVTQEIPVSFCVSWTIATARSVDCCWARKELPRFLTDIILHSSTTRVCVSVCVCGEKPGFPIL